MYDGDPLYCGSIKTVVGHLEGCAGLAGILKASLAIQNRFIPPNMHFKELNPAIHPFYQNLLVPTSSIPWPETTGPLRASVNSFGFGGTNAHAILESYEPPSDSITGDPDVQNSTTPNMLPGPFVFSAKSRTSLLGNLKRMLDYVSQNPSLDLDILSWVLQSRRTHFACRLTIPASNRLKFLESLRKQIEAAEASNIAVLGVRALSEESQHGRKILGIFTGQVRS